VLGLEHWVRSRLIDEIGRINEKTGADA